MGRSVNSRNRVFTATEDGIKTEAFDPSLLTDPHLIIYSPVRVLGNKTIVTNGDQTDTIYELMDKQMTFEQSFFRAVLKRQRVRRRRSELYAQDLRHHAR